ncbi:hypothetical protein EYF80_013938 [Liparis tanakae]|uniref:Uncharacterized protein n=1 Tax=Liparis tanakae TaxID=230148 RepID=A0A4Z2IDI4_9TELE|nr:hypothetical protein EYF80_013938 [Liparis tanakae]
MRPTPIPSDLPAMRPTPFPSDLTVPAPSVHGSRSQRRRVTGVSPSGNSFPITCRSSAGAAADSRSPSGVGRSADGSRESVPAPTGHGEQGSAIAPLVVLRFVNVVLIGRCCAEGGVQAALDNALWGLPESQRMSEYINSHQDTGPLRCLPAAMDWDKRPVCPHQRLGLESPLPRPSQHH